MSRVSARYEARWFEQMCKQLVRPSIATVSPRLEGQSAEAVPKSAQRFRCRMGKSPGQVFSTTEKLILE